MNDRWPICGKCCEVAPFSWLGGPHRCLVPRRRQDQNEPPHGWTRDAWAEEQIRRNFEHGLATALAGEMQPSCTLGVRHPVDSETSDALGKVAENPTSQAIAAAYEELERQLDGTHDRNSRAMWEQACKRYAEAYERDHGHPPRKPTSRG